jgi:hypothetical protein
MITIYTAGNITLPFGQPFTLAEIQYPANWLQLASVDDLEAHGIVRNEAPDPTPAPLTKEQLSAYAADKRYRVETGGCSDGMGHIVDTTRDSQTKLIAEMVALGGGLRTDGSPWKMKVGGFVSISNTQMLAVIMAVRTHIASAFAAENAATDSIDSGAITTAAEIDAVSWPSNT